MVDALDTLYIMELEEEFQEAKKWVEKSFDLNVVSQCLGMPVPVTRIPCIWSLLITAFSEPFGEGNCEVWGGRSQCHDSSACTGLPAGGHQIRLPVSTRK